jgi:hypothetical protein
LLAKTYPATATGRAATIAFGVSPDGRNFPLFLGDDTIKVVDRLLECSLEPGLALGVGFARILSNLSVPGSAALIHAADATWQARSSAIGVAGTTCTAAHATRHLTAETAYTAASTAAAAGTTSRGTPGRSAGRSARGTTRHATGGAAR